ncbi:MAG: PilZ domain-containing protein [Gammaproteobacteria bacterium]|nr:PilZ domain-containing protein [Gammaproteobacteria bacterium]
MERRRHARTPVDINALLIGEKTLPRGFRVINVSQHGMMLYCDTDNRLSSLSAGDSVDIHLTVQHAGEQKKLTIPSHVRHVAENSIDVEFQHPDAILMDLIESYRISDQYKLEALLGSDTATTGKITPIADSSDDSAPGTQQETTQTSELAGSHKPFYPGLLTLILATCIITGGYIYTASIDGRISTLETRAEQQSSELSELKNHTLGISLPEGRHSSLNTPMTAPGDTVTRQKDEPTLLIQRSDVSAKTTEDTGASPAARIEAAATLTNEPGATPATSAPAHSGPTSSELAESSAALPGTVAPWTINLLSSPDRVYVEQFAARARAQDINVVVSEADVRGRHYWRLQIPGFHSAADAKAHAEPVKQALGIQNVWILKKK